MDVVPIITRWVHVVAAVIAVGGSFFIRVVLHSAMNALTDDAKSVLRERVLARWKWVVRGCIAALLLTGLFNYLTITRFLHKGQPAYHALMGVKILLALVVFTIADGIVGRAPPFAFMRRNVPTWIAISLMLSAAILAISASLRFMPVVATTP